MNRKQAFVVFVFGLVFSFSLGMVFINYPERDCLMLLTVIIVVPCLAELADIKIARKLRTETVTVMMARAARRRLT